MKELLQMLGVLNEILFKGDLTKSVYLVVRTDGSGMVKTDYPIGSLDSKPRSLFPFKDADELRQNLLAEIGEAVFEARMESEKNQ